jgi:hypothetical protein
MEEEFKELITQKLLIMVLYYNKKKL